MKAIDAAQARRFLWAAIGIGIAMRLLWASNTPGHPFDIGSYRLVAETLRDSPLDVYALANPPGVHRWPYPPGYFPWLALIADLDVRLLAPLPAILADGLLAWLVWNGLGRSGAGEEKRLLGAMAVIVGPSFIFASAHHGQFDALAIAPAVAALLVWERGGADRALKAGLLIGFGALLKTAPGLMLFALLPTATARERWTLAGTAAAVVAVPLAPFAVHDAAAVARALTYSGIPGMGGLSLLAQPELAKVYVLAEQFDVRANGIVRFMDDFGVLITAPALLAAAAVAWRRRLPAREAALLLWLTFLVFQTAFAFQYAVWALPFLLLTGHVAGGAALQAGLLIPIYLYYYGEWPAGDTWRWWVYVVLMLGVWAALIESLRRARSRRWR